MDHNHAENITMEYYITEESIAYYRESIANAVKTPDVIGERTRALLKYTQEHDFPLGPHLFMLTDTLEVIAQTADEAALSAKEVCNLLLKVADGYDEVLRKDRLDPFSNNKRKDG